MVKVRDIRLISKSVRARFVEGIINSERPAGRVRADRYVRILSVAPWRATATRCNCACGTVVSSGERCSRPRWINERNVYSAN